MIDVLMWVVGIGLYGLGAVVDYHFTEPELDGRVQGICILLWPLHLVLVGLVMVWCGLYLTVFGE